MTAQQRFPMLVSQETGTRVRNITLTSATVQGRGREAGESEGASDELLRLKSAYLTSMSHEIRTLLTGIVGLSEHLVEEVPEGLRGIVDLMNKNSHRLLHTLNSVLDLAQMESGVLKLHPEWLSVSTELVEAAEVFRPRAMAKGLYLHVKPSSLPVLAEVDRGVLTRVLNNLIGNAIKFTQRGGVTVSVKREAGEVVLTVADTGIGIEPHFLPHLFEEFRQEASARPQREGSGLGLAITRRLVEHLHGKIFVESEAHKGTTFTIRFPATGSAGGTARIEETEVGSGRSRILVVEDNEETRMVLQLLLSRDFEVEIAATGEAALGLTRWTRFDLVICDISLGDGISGFDVLEQLRANPDYEHVPIIALTAHALPSDEERFLGAGFDRYVRKPFSRADLLHAIHALIPAPYASAA